MSELICRRFNSGADRFSGTPIYRRSSRIVSASSRTRNMYIPVVFAPTSDRETDTRTNYFRSHKQSRDLKGEFKLFASFTRPRRSRLLAHSLLSFQPSSLHLILDTLPSFLPFVSFFSSLALLPSPRNPGWARVVAAVAAVHQERSRDASLRLKPID